MAVATFHTYAEAGLSVLPLRLDGTKAPALDTWKEFETTIAGDALRTRWQQQGRGIGVIGGEVSGGLEVIDIDEHWIVEPYLAEVEKLCPGLIARLPMVQTPSEGLHLYYRSAVPQGNQKLAMRRDGLDEKGREKFKTLVETRGRGGYVAAPGSPLACHSTGKPYVHAGGPPITETPPITAAEREILLRVGASFNQVADEQESEPTHRTNGKPRVGTAPGDDFNQRATWEEILEPHKWEKVYVSAGTTKWKRPGKDDHGWSATTGLVSKAGNELLCVFSSNAHPFPGPTAGRTCSTHSKFDAYARLNHDGDHTAAARELGRNGYGDAPQRDRANGADRQSARPRPNEAGQEPPRKIEFKRITSAELAETTYNLEFLVDRTLVAGQPAIIAGGKKSLKTSIVVDLAVSLATAGWFLGKLKVNRACRVAVMSGESGEATLQETAIRVCEAANRNLADISNLIWSPDLPRFDSVLHRDALAEFLQDDEIEVVFLDPAYLCMPSQDSGNLFAQGELLRAMSETCRDVGAMAVIVHHTKKGIVDPYAPPELEDIAWAGFQEHCRQWLLVGRRERYEPGTGEHRLWLNVGGSAGHSALWAVDVSEGVYDGITPRHWDVSVSHADEARQDARQREQERRESDKQAKQEVEEREARKKVCQALAKFPDGETFSVIRSYASLGPARCEKAIGTLLNDGDIEPCKVEKNGRPEDGFKLARPLD